MKPMTIMTLEEVQARYPGSASASQETYLTQEVLDNIATIIGQREPETGGKLFGPADRNGADLFEFDKHGSANASTCVYEPDQDWAQKRADYWLNQKDNTKQRLWHGDVHSHPGRLGHPSADAGNQTGDLGLAAAILRDNDFISTFGMFIVTFCDKGHPVLWPWVVERGDTPLVPRLAKVVVTKPANFPKRIMPTRFASPEDRTSIHLDIKTIEQKTNTTIYESGNLLLVRHPAGHRLTVSIPQNIYELPPSVTFQQMGTKGAYPIPVNRHPSSHTRLENRLSALIHHTLAFAIRRF